MCVLRSTEAQLSVAFGRYAGTLTLLVIYGYRVTSNNDPFVNLAEECVDILSNHIASGGGIWPVDVFPFRECHFCSLIHAGRRTACPDVLWSATSPTLVSRSRVQAQGDSMEGEDAGVHRQAV